MIKNQLTLTIALCPFIFMAPAIAADTTMTFREYVEKANNYIEEYQHLEASDALKEATKQGEKNIHLCICGWASSITV